MKEKINLTGQQFGRWTVLKEVEPIGYNRRWLCQCNCEKHTQKIVYQNSLTTGQSKSCGCYQKDLNTQKFLKDITGEKFGLLTALYPTSKRDPNNGGVIWACQCDCGNIVFKNGITLRDGNVKSCGCLGKSYGEKTIEQILEKNNIFFEKEKTFKNCKFLETNYPAKFDFYINNKYVIEFDGEQHFIEREYFGGKEGLEKRQKYDNFKNQWCKNNNIPLIRIPYTHLKDICLEDLLLETSKFIVE